LTAHLLTWLLFLPFAGALVAVAMRVVGYDVEKNVQRAPLVVASLEALFGLVLLVSFHGEVTRADGNDGFQFVERMTILPSLGIEYYVGVDGTSVSLVLIATLLGVVASFASYRAIVRDRASVLRQAAYYSGCQLLWGAAMGVFIAVDLALFAFFWALLVGALGLLIRELTRGDRAGPHPALTKLFAYGAVSVTCVVFAVVELHQHSNATFLGDGTRVAHSFALPELMRVGYNAKQLTLFGTAWVKVVYGALFVGFVVLVPSPPFHRWLVALFDDARAASAPAAMFVVGVVVNAGIYGLLRVSVDILPDASRWAATTLLVLGVVNVLTGAGLALVSKDIRHVVAYGVVAQAGFCLVGVGAMTREGFFGCLLQTSSRSLVAAVVAFFALGLYDSTPPEADVPTESRASKIAGFALLASVGVPGLSTFWGETVSVLGAFPSARLLAGAATFGGVVLAVAYVRAARSLLVLPTAVSASRKAKADLAMRDLLTLAPVVVFCVALGLFPAGLLRLVGGGVSDLNQLVNPPGPDEIL
jgi:NADH-quinone oxidoreductase subunit M